MEELDKADKDQIEKDIRELTGLDKKPDEPVILDLESIRVIRPGKFEIDIVSLFSKKKPLIYKLEEGKYIIDIASTLDVRGFEDEIKKKIKDPDELGSELEKKEALRRTVVSALVYPIFVTAATLGVTGLLMVYIFPKILPIFSSVGVKLPITTVILIEVSSFLRSYGLALLGVLVAISVGLVVLHRNVSTFRIVSDRILLKIPISGRIMQNYNMANITRTFGLLLKSGVTVVDAIETTAQSTRNRVYQRELQRAAEHVKKGEQVSDHFKKHRGLFPILVSHMISIGEKTGNLSDTLVYLSGMYEEEVDTMTKNLSHAIEPVLMIVMGLLVGFVAVSVISPIYEITQTISEQI